MRLKIMIKREQSEKPDARQASVTVAPPERSFAAFESLRDSI